MSELKKLRLNLEEDFYIKLCKLQSECKHELTHWVQEITQEGYLKQGLFKRCYICGFTIDRFDTDLEFQNQLLNEFDYHVERKIREQNENNNH
jgi:hypothetical protein